LISFFSIGKHHATRHQQSRNFYNPEKRMFQAQTKSLQQKDEINSKMN
jgi:hypothetical protein